MLSPIHVRNFNNFRFFKSAKMSFDITESQNFQFGMFYCRLINHAIFGTLWIGKKNCQKIQILSMLNLSLKCARFYDLGLISCCSSKGQSSIYRQNQRFMCEIQYFSSMGEWGRAGLCPHLHFCSFVESLRFLVTCNIFVETMLRYCSDH